MVVRKLNVQELDKLTIKLYNEFYENNKELFKRDLIEYFGVARPYVEDGIYREIYFKN